MELTHDQAEVLEKLEAFARGEGDSAVAALSGYAGVGKTRPRLRAIARICATAAGTAARCPSPICVRCSVVARGLIASASCGNAATSSRSARL